jgi:tetratricopeptide (TPR) repeat protein
MKNSILASFIFTLLLCCTVNAQKLTPELLKNQDLSNHKQILKQALTYSDAAVAINSMHHIIALEGANSTYKDSLAIVYYRSGNYMSSHLLAKELLEKKPDDIQLLEIDATSLQQLGAAKEAITVYETLFAKTQNMGHGYQLAFLQFNLKRFGEAKATIDKTLQCKEIDKAYMQFPIDKTQNQNVPLKAAAYNLQGLIAYELKDNATASRAFGEALKIMPEFTTATQNANAITVELQNQNAKDAKTPKK